jgi:hypothetical protein
MPTVLNTFREMLSKKKAGARYTYLFIPHKKKPPDGEVFVKGECFSII